MAERTQARFESLSAVGSGVKEIREVVDRAREARQFYQRKTLLFFDEIHRLNRSQQDALLPHVENGLVTLIGATTENPSFEVNSALLSRVRVLRLEPLHEEEVRTLIERALSDPIRGLGGRLKLSDRAVKELARSVGGDARRALTLLESLELSGAGQDTVLDDLKQLLPHDTRGDQHFDLLSALIKSIRASDPQASIYYLARLLEVGEDLMLLCRRLVIAAAEDVGLGDPRALMLAVSTQQGVHFTGMPEARILLAELVIYLSLAPKSNSAYLAIDRALSEVRSSGALPVPLHLRNPVTDLARKQGHGDGYRYAHDEPHRIGPGDSLPEVLRSKKFFEPVLVGSEKALKERLEWIESVRGTFEEGLKE
jgi:putative ATPase